VGAACLLVCAEASAQYGADPSAVEIAPFAGFQFGGGFQTFSGQHTSLGSGLDYGGTLDIRVAPTWCVEALYSRQSTELGGDDSPFGVTAERLMAGIVEEQGEPRSRFFGVALLGATRFKAGLPGYGSSTLFTIGLGLGVKQMMSENIGIRAEARGFYTITEAGGGIFCSGGCLFTFSGSGLWQGDVTGGIVLSF
jgi:hypothetical protein